MHKPTTHHKARLVMRDAWRIARRAQPIYGGSVRSYLAEALREAWAALKADPLTTAVDQIIAGIKSRRSQPQSIALSAGLIRAANLHHNGRHMPGYAWSPRHHVQAAG